MQDPTLKGPPGKALTVDPLAVQHLNNWLFMMNALLTGAETNLMQTNLPLAAVSYFCIMGIYN